jgi:hypothetical protein
VVRVVEIHDLTDRQAEEAIERGEFGKDVIGSSTNVAVILTQDWCPQWTAMSGWLAELKRGGTVVPDIRVYRLLYNRKEYFRRFLDFKEGTLQNRLVPYVRYYVGGKLVSQSNYVSKQEFLSAFQSG